MIQLHMTKWLLYIHLGMHLILCVNTIVRSPRVKFKSKTQSVFVRYMHCTDTPRFIGSTIQIIIHIITTIYRKKKIFPPTLNNNKSRRIKCMYCIHNTNTYIAVVASCWHSSFRNCIKYSIEWVIARNK